jgi:hypothetical protein
LRSGLAWRVRLTLVLLLALARRLILLLLLLLLAGRLEINLGERSLLLRLDDLQRSGLQRCNRSSRNWDHH